MRNSCNRNTAHSNKLQTTGVFENGNELRIIEIAEFSASFCYTYISDSWFFFLFCTFNQTINEQ